ncbi:hypothetical protein RHSIM_Rhsim04G0161200 [Rhododendron simsii]|uniref:EGF-like domain-containing protein n=1 Tax=Rhododendron simsii TaxID=118357 RepID=A0A834H059_RHOSS|nr:hypothetical protein RHSIM_Rhsim04G0161200 [Rhododendron simsii]
MSTTASMSLPSSPSCYQDQTHPFLLFRLVLSSLGFRNFTAATPSLANSTVWRGPVTFFAPSNSSLFTYVVVHGIGIVHRSEGRVKAMVESNFLSYYIDECNNTALNNCHEKAKCTNTAGSFNCTCLDHYYGGGRKDHGSTGCLPVASQSSGIKLSLALVIISVLDGAIAQS